MRTLPRLFLAMFLLVALTNCVRRVITMPAGQPREDPPPGMVELNILSDDPGLVWDVFAGGNPVCSTPCVRQVAAYEPLMLKSRDDEYVYVELDADVEDARRAAVVAEGTHHGEQVNGIIFTTLGGMGTIIATTFTAIGCSDVQERRGMCTAGLITGAVSVPLTAVSIWMIVDSLPDVHVFPVSRPPAPKGSPPLTLTVTPTGLAGTF